MKKTYMMPQINVVKMNTCGMLAASDQIGVGGSYNGSSTIQAPEFNGYWDED